MSRRQPERGQVTKHSTFAAKKAAQPITDYQHTSIACSEPEIECTYENASHIPSGTGAPLSQTAFMPPLAFAWFAATSASSSSCTTTRRARLVAYRGKFWASSFSVCSGDDDGAAALSWRSCAAWKPTLSSSSGVRGSVAASVVAGSGYWCSSVRTGSLSYVSAADVSACGASESAPVLRCQQKYTVYRRVHTHCAVIKRKIVCLLQIKGHAISTEVSPLFAVLVLARRDMPENILDMGLCSSGCRVQHFVQCAESIRVRGDCGVEHGGAWWSCERPFWGRRDVVKRKQLWVHERTGLSSDGLIPLQSHCHVLVPRPTVCALNRLYAHKLTQLFGVAHNLSVPVYPAHAVASPGRLAVGVVLVRGLHPRHSGVQCEGHLERRQRAGCGEMSRCESVLEDVAVGVFIGLRVSKR